MFSGGQLDPPDEFAHVYVRRRCRLTDLRNV